MISYMCGIIANYFLFVHSFIGIDFVIACAVVISAWALVYKLMHAKTI